MYAIRESVDYYMLQKELEQIAKDCFIEYDEMLRLIYQGWDKAVDRAIGKGILSTKMEENLLSFPEFFSLPNSKSKHNLNLSRIRDARQARIDWEDRQRQFAERKRQQELRERQRIGKQIIIDAVISQGSKPIRDKSFIREINNITATYELTLNMRKNAVNEGWQEAVNQADRMSYTDIDSHKNLLVLAEELKIPQVILANSKALYKLEKKVLKEKQLVGKEFIIEIIRQHGDKPIVDKSLIRHINRVAKNHHVSRKLLGESIVAGWDLAVYDTVHKSTFNSDTYGNLIILAEKLSIPKSMVVKSEAMSKLEKKQVLDDLSKGRMPIALIFAPGELPFNLTRSETLVWLFENTRLVEWTMIKPGLVDDRGRVYEPSYKWVEADYGLMGVTTWHIYFAGKNVRLRVPYNNIISFDMVENGLLITRDGTDPQIQFITGDSLFTYDLVTHLAQM